MEEFFHCVKENISDIQDTLTDRMVTFNNLEVINRNYQEYVELLTVLQLNPERFHDSEICIDSKSVADFKDYTQKLNDMLFRDVQVEIGGTVNRYMEVSYRILTNSYCD